MNLNQNFEPIEPERLLTPAHAERQNTIQPMFLCGASTNKVCRSSRHNESAMCRRPADSTIARADAEHRLSANSCILLVLAS
jgi:hypothetical protein